MAYICCGLRIKGGDLQASREESGNRRRVICIEDNSLYQIDRRFSIKEENWLEPK